MLRVDTHDSGNSLNVKFEGRFTGDAAENTLALLTHCAEGTRLLVDLTEVTFVDFIGEKVLASFGRFGAEFVAQTSYTLDLCERLHLGLARGGAPDEHPSEPSSKDGHRSET
jgi:hypothetical protein